MTYTIAAAGNIPAQLTITNAATQAHRVVNIMKALAPQQLLTQVARRDLKRKAADLLSADKKVGHIVFLTYNSNDEEGVGGVVIPQDRITNLRDNVELYNNNGFVTLAFSDSHRTDSSVSMVLALPTKLLLNFLNYGTQVLRSNNRITSSSEATTTSRSKTATYTSFSVDLLLEYAELEGVDVSEAQQRWAAFMEGEYGDTGVVVATDTVTDTVVGVPQPATAAVTSPQTPLADTTNLRHAPLVVEAKRHEGSTTQLEAPARPVEPTLGTFTPTDTTHAFLSLTEASERTLDEDVIQRGFQAAQTEAEQELEEVVSTVARRRTRNHRRNNDEGTKSTRRYSSSTRQSRRNSRTGATPPHVAVNGSTYDAALGFYVNSNGFRDSHVDHSTGEVVEADW